MHGPCHPVGPWACYAGGMIDSPKVPESAQLQRGRRMQMVELHFATPPALNLRVLHTRAEEILGEPLDSSPHDETKQALILFHKSHPFAVKDGTLFPQTALLRADQPVNLEVLQSLFEQSWRCREAAEVLASSLHTLLVTELMAQQLPPVERLRLFHGVLQAAVEQTQPLALVWRHSQQVIRTADYLESVGDEPVLRPGTLNVRFFNIAETDGDMLMDTRGLAELDLPDLQCHFRGLDPNGLSRVLFNTAIYLVEQGPVIESGHTIQGIEPGSKWSCQEEDALIGPERTVLDLNPGPPFAAGDRGD